MVKDYRKRKNDKCFSTPSNVMFRYYFVSYRVMNNKNKIEVV